jgi:hypothetical protein
MKNIKILSAFIFTLFALQLESSDNQNSQDLEFPQHTTEKYIYNKTVSQRDHQSMYSRIFGRYANGKSVTDVTSEDLLSHRVTRKRTEVNTEHGISLITTETWTSRNPSYVTWVNGALVVAAIAGIVLGATTINSVGNVASQGLNTAGHITGGALQSQNSDLRQAGIEMANGVANVLTGEKSKTYFR